MLELDTTGTVEPDKGDAAAVSAMLMVQQQVLDALISPSIPAQINPILKAAWLIKMRELKGELDLPALMELQPELDAAMKVASQEAARITQTLATLKNAPATSCRGFVWAGF